MSDAKKKEGEHRLPFYDVIDAQVTRMQTNGFHLTAAPILWTGVIALIVTFIFFPQQSFNDFSLLVFLSPIWITFILIYFTVIRFVQTKRAEFLLEQEYTLLEIRIPRDTHKTPAAMEAFFSSLSIGSGETTWYKKYIQGGMRPTWSLEIVSLGGRIHFFIRTRTGYRRLTEAYLYAQYPDAEVIEVEDYSRFVNPSEHGYSMFACEHSLSDKKSDALPIKTYIDYKLEPGDKPDETVDPLAQLIETIGALGPSEEFWLQFVIRQTKLEKFNGKKNADGKDYSFADLVKETIEGIRAQAVQKIKRTDPVTGKVTEDERFPNPTKGQAEIIAAIERKANKQVFDVGIRTVYLGTEAAFQGIMIPGLLSLFKPFNYEGSQGNSINVVGVWTAAFNDLPWQDIGGHHKHYLNQQAIRMYRQRSFYADPYKGGWSIMSTEELATLFHIPSASVTTPNLPRIQSATSGAPANLPT